MIDEQRKDARRRLRSIAGHVSGILRMIEDGRYCIDVIRQIEAVEGALGRVKARLLSRHLETCVTDALRGPSPAERKRVLRELTEIYHALRRFKRAAPG